MNRLTKCAYGWALLVAFVAFVVVDAVRRRVVG
jgi:hypothetical protein